MRCWYGNLLQLSTVNSEMMCVSIGLLGRHIAKIVIFVEILFEAQGLKWRCDVSKYWYSGKCW